MITGMDEIYQRLETTVAKYDLNPNSELLDLCNELTSETASVYMEIGLQVGILLMQEIKKNKDGENVFVAYSLGNYISSIDNEKSKVELVLNIELRKKGDTGEVVLSKVDYTPIYVLDNGENAENRFVLKAGKE